MSSLLHAVILAYSYEAEALIQHSTKVAPSSRPETTPLLQESAYLLLKACVELLSGLSAQRRLIAKILKNFEAVTQALGRADLALLSLLEARSTCSCPDTKIQLARAIANLLNGVES